MLAEDRKSRILELVNEKKSVTVEELTELLHTSESTVRRDLVQLAKLGRINKVHGGATAIDRQYIMVDQSMAEKSGQHREEKHAIAKYAAGLIVEDDFVYIDAGSTTDLLVDCIEEMRAVYVTNSVTHAGKLAQKGCRVIVPEGELKIISEAIIGPETTRSLRKYHFSKGFFGTNGVSAETGFTTPESAEAAVKRCAIEQCVKAYVLCDSSKFEQISPVTFANFTDAEIITDRLQNPKYASYSHITQVR
jgi:DeoR family fructose operon transcriptional repressor